MDPVRNNCIDEVVSILADSEGIKNYTEEIAAGTVKGDNYVGNITSITIRGENEQGKEKVLKLIAKMAPTNEKFREEIMIARAFRVEIFMYTKVFETFASFEKQKGIEKPFDSYARCLYTSSVAPNEILVFDDLKEQGYKLWNRKSFMNPEHVSLVLRQYGKFHAISFAMRDQNKELYDGLKFEDNAKLKVIFKEKWLPMLKTNLDNTKQIFEEGAPEREYLEKVKNMIETYYAASWEEDEYWAILHGDCWCNNMMFKYQDDPLEPTEMRFLDFQVSKKGNPMLDVSYFFYCNASKEIYTNVERYMNVYYESFSQHLKALGSDPDTLYPFDVFRTNWKEHTVNGLCIVLILTRTLISDQNEALDFVKTVEDGKPILEAYDVKIANEDLYRSRIRDLVARLTEMNFY